MAAKDPQSPSNEPEGAGQGRPAKADWRRPSPHAAPAAAARKKGGGAWRAKPDRAYEDARRWYRIRVASWVLFVVALFVVFIVAIIYWPRRTPLVAMAVTEYEDYTSRAVLPNAWAREDVESFRDLDTQGEIVDYSNPYFAPAKTGEAAFEGLREEIRKRSGWRNRTVLVYLSVHGVVNQDGKPCLLLPGDSPLESDKWLTLESLLDYLFPADAQGPLPGKKLLILDCNRMDANWRLGLLYNSFADGLKDVVQKVPGLAILNSTGSGQIGWTSPEQLHGSVFAYFVRQGLQGAADASDEGGNNNGDVSLQELAGYVRKRVRQWVLEHRADIQEPKLFTEEKDFFLVHAKRGARSEIPTVKTDFRTRWTTDIEPLWSRHEELRTKKPWRIHPLGWEAFQQGLLRLERLAVAGPSYDEQYARLKDELNAEVEGLTDQGLPKELAVSSIPLRLRLAGDAEARKIEEERKTLRAQWNQAQQRFAAEAARETSYLAAAAEAWRQCLLGVDPAHWPGLLQFVDAEGRRARPAGDVVEMHFLRSLNAYLDPPTLKDHRTAVERAMLVRDRAEEAAAPEDERVHYWIQAAVDKADDQRRRAEDRIFVGDPDSIRGAERALDALASSDGRAGAYPDAIRQSEELAKAFALRDRAWAEIPDYARWLMARLHPQNDRQVQLLESLIQNTHTLGYELDRAIAKRDFPAAEWKKAYQAAETARNALANEFLEECTRLWERAPLNRETLREITVVLSVPLVSGKQRNGLWGNYWEIAAGKREGEEGSPAKPDEKGKTEDAKAGPATEDFRVAGTADQEATAAYLKRLPARHPALTILDRSRLGVDEPACLRAAAAPAVSSGSSDDLSARLSRLAVQGQCVRELLAVGSESVSKQCAAWLKDSEARLDLGDRSLVESREGRAKADRLVRAAASLMDLGRAAWDKPESDPPHQLRRLDLHDLLAWQAFRTLDDFWGRPPARPQAPAFFVTATEEYLRSASALCPNVKRLRYEGPELKEPVNLQERLRVRTKAAEDALTPKAADLSIKKADPGASKAQEATTPGEVDAGIAENLPAGTAALFIRDPATGNPEEQTIPMLIQGDQGRSEWRRIGRAVKPSQRELPQRYSVRSDDPRLQHATLEAVGLYRGHEYVYKFTATPPDYELVYTPPKYPPPVVSVFGEAVQEPCPVVFVLDCSASMEENIRGIRELRRKRGQAAGAAAKVPRFAIARDALKQILERLAKSEMPYDVGMIVYGHRVGWGGLLDAAQNKYEIVVWDPKIPDKTILRPEDNPLLPAEDVEVLRPLSPFGTAELASLTRELDALHPLGETPLYLAIRTALEELRSKQPSKDLRRTARRHVLVITDGMNEVSGEGKRVLKSDLSEMFRRSEYRDVSLDVVGFNLTDWDLLWQCVDRDQNRTKLAAALAPLEQQGMSAIDAAAKVDPALIGRLEEAQRKRLELQELVAETKHPAEGPDAAASASKGFYHVDEDSGISQVVEALRQSLDLRRAKFAVERASDAATVGTAELGQAVEIEKHVGVKPYVVKVGEADRVASAQVVLEGGEYEMLYLSKDGIRLEHRRYDKNLRVQSENLPDPADPENAARRFFVGAHIPDWKGSAVQFWLSIQNQNAARFSPRPEEAWIQVRPLVPDTETVPYVCYDLAFEPRLPVPMLTFVAPDWPPKAEEAEVQLWFKLTKTQPDPQHVLSVDDLRKRGGLQLPDVPGAVFTVDTRPGVQGSPYQVVVTERSAPAKPIPGVRVEMDPMPERISRQYNQKAGTVHNTFYYDAAVAAQAGAFRILLTPHSRLSERAVTLPAPLKVGIARRSR